MKKISIIILALAAIVFTSCSGFLDKEPILSQSTELTMGSYAGLDKATAGAYGPLASTTWYGAAFVLNNDMMSGNASREADGAFQSNRYTTSYNWNFSADNTFGAMWSLAYYEISAVNNILANLDDKVGTLKIDGVSVVTEQEIANLKAECLFLRALSHFNLVLTFGQPYTSSKESLGVPVVLKTDPNGAPARNTVAEVYAQIVTDLTEAEAAIADDYKRSNFTDAKAVVSKPAIQALLSRVYLYMGEWQKSADYATKVISNKKYTMWTAENYTKVWGLKKAADDGEVIFEVYGTKTNDYYGSWEDISYVTSPEGYADVRASKDLLALYTEGDVRAKMFRTDAKNESGGLMWSTKYPGKGEGTPDANNVIILRLSEMYLNRAEALVNGAIISGTTAVSDVNVIRSNRGLENVTSVGRGDIQIERRLELAFEGTYLFDLRRWGKSLTRTDFTGSINQNVDFPSYRWAAPISKRELEVNKNLVQNEGY